MKAKWFERGTKLYQVYENMIFETDFKGGCMRFEVEYVIYHQ